jgi:hypothetical protein
MKYLSPLLVVSLLAVCASCSVQHEKRAVNEFGQQYLEMQHDYCSTNIFVAQQGLARFRDWLSNTNHEVVGVGRDYVIYQVYGRLFLVSEYVGDSYASELDYEKSTAAWNKYIQEIPPAPRGHEPITTKQELRDSLARHDKGLAVGWMKR